MAKVMKYKVQGRCSFPLDMLRYDHCYPATEEDSSKIFDSLSNGFSKEQYTIGICTHSNMVTPERWASFGWKVIK